MADTYVQLPADSTGQKLRMESAVVGGSTVLQQVSTLADASGNLVTATGNKLDVNASGTVAVSNFPTIGDATAANQTTLNTEVGALTETAPATDTASSGLNGRLQRIAQRLSSLIGLFPTSLGQKTSANSFAVTVASDQSAVPVTGTFWQATQPVSGTVTANAGTGTMTVDQRSRTATTADAVNATNAAAVITYAAAGAGVANVVGAVYWSYSSTPTGGSLKIEDGTGTTVFQVDITAPGPGFFEFPRPLKGTGNTALIVTLAAGGTGVVGRINARKWTE